MAGARRGPAPRRIAQLAAGLTADGPLLPVEVELASKSLARLRAILALHASWIAAGQTSAVIYVVGPARLGDRVREQAARVGLAPEHKTLRVELLATVRAAARAARRGPAPGSTGTAATWEAA